MTQNRRKVSNNSTLAVSADEFIEEEMSAGGWKPPAQFIPHLDKFIKHNREHPECRVGAIKIAAWLGRNGITTSKDAVYRWLKKRSKLVQ